VRQVCASLDRVELLQALGICVYNIGDKYVRGLARLSPIIC
jgi:hypothetical protein